MHQLPHFFMTGLTKLCHSASQRHVFACGSKVRADLLVCGFSALRTEKPHTIEKERTTLPKAQYANCVSPLRIDQPDRQQATTVLLHCAS